MLQICLLSESGGKMRFRESDSIYECDRIMEIRADSRTSVKFIGIRAGFAKRCKSRLSRYPAVANTRPRIQRELALPKWRAKAIKHPARNFAKLSVVQRCANNLAILYLFDETEMEKDITDDARKREDERGRQRGMSRMSINRGKKINRRCNISCVKGERNIF